MYFTREPIIETIISPREGYKLVLRSSKQDREEEFCVDSVEVVNFGNHCFYRSIDRSVTFLLPVFDYEIVEARSARMTMKSAAPAQEKEIKIGKGKEGGEHSHEEKKKEKRSSRKRKEKGSDRPREEAQAQPEIVAEVIPPPPIEEAPKPKPKPKMESAPRALIPPPTTLISDSIARYYQAVPKEERMMIEDEPMEFVGLEEENDIGLGQ